MLGHYGSRGTITAGLLIVVTLFALANIWQHLNYGTLQQVRARVESAPQLEQETFVDHDASAEDLIESAKAALELDAVKSDEQRKAEADAEVRKEELARAEAERLEAEAQAEADAKSREDVKEEEDAKSKQDAEAQSQPVPMDGEVAKTKPKEPTKVVVMGKMQHEDAGWVKDLSDWKSAVYCVDLNATAPCESGLKTKVNKAKEAMPYLSYIVDHYDDLPDVMAFVHAHRNGMPQAWHNDAPKHDAVRMLQELKTQYVLDQGYANLRCISTIGCPDEVQPFRSPPEEDKHAEHAYPYFYAHFFDATFEEMKANISVVATPCCAQFAVSKEQVLKRGLAFYERVRDYLETTHYDDDTSGRVMEYMWHIIFGRDAVHCDELFDCWCKVYGRCRRGHFNWKG